MGVYLQPQHQGVACHCEFNLPFNPTDRTEVSRVEEFFARASEELIVQGAYFSRPYGIWADMVYRRDVQSTNLLKGIKNEDVVNPDGSLRLDDLFGYLKPQVERIARKQYNNEQTPQLIVSENL